VPPRKPEISTGHPQPNNKGKDMKDEYSELRAAFHAGATIQAYTTADPYETGLTPLAYCGPGYWRDLSCDGEPKFSCHPTRYRVKPEDAP
jgi:hypothetical protein